MNAPDYEFLSAPLGWITLLHLVTLTLHFVAMGALFGGLGALLLLPAGDKWREPQVRSAVRLLPTLMALTVTLGVAPLLFLQLVYHRQVYAAAIVSAWYWLGLVAAAIGAYYLLYAAAFAAAADRLRGAKRLATAFALLLFVSLVLSSVLTLAETPATLVAAWAHDASGTVLNPDFARWIPRWMHLVAGALTLGSFGLAFFVRNEKRLYGPASRLALATMLAAILLGVAALAGLGSALRPFMRSAGIWWLLGSLLTALGAMHFLLRRRLVPAAILLLASLVGMVVQRHLARLLVLGPAFDPGAMSVRPQWGVFALFLSCFVGMLATIAWMLHLFFGRSRASSLT